MQSKNIPDQSFSTRVPCVAARGSVDMDRNCLGQNSHSQFYVLVPMFQRFITESRIDTWVIA